MGWLGYTEQETLETSMPALIRGYEGHVDKMKAFAGLVGFGPGEPEAPKPEPAAPDQVRGILRALAG